MKKQLCMILTVLMFTLAFMQIVNTGLIANEHQTLQSVAAEPTPTVYGVYNVVQPDTGLTAELITTTVNLQFDFGYQGYSNISSFLAVQIPDGWYVAGAEFTGSSEGRFSENQDLEKSATHIPSEFPAVPGYYWWVGYSGYNLPENAKIDVNLVLLTGVNTGSFTLNYKTGFCYPTTFIVGGMLSGLSGFPITITPGTEKMLFYPDSEQGYGAVGSFNRQRPATLYNMSSITELISITETGNIWPTGIYQQETKVYDGDPGFAAIIELPYLQELDSNILIPPGGKFDFIVGVDIPGSALPVDTDTVELNTAPPQFKNAEGKTANGIPSNSADFTTTATIQKAYSFMSFYHAVQVFDPIERKPLYSFPVDGVGTQRRTKGQLSQDGGKLYAYGTNIENIAVFDTKNDQPCGSISTAMLKDMGISADGTKGYYIDNTLSIFTFSILTNERITGVNIGIDNIPYGLECNPCKSIVYFLAYDSETEIRKIIAIDTADDSIIAEKTISEVADLLSLAVSPDGKRIYAIVTERYMYSYINNIIMMDAATLQTIDRQANNEYLFDRIIISPDGKKVYALNKFNGSIFIFSTQNLEYLNMIDAWENDEDAYLDMKLDNEGKYLYVSYSTTKKIRVFDTLTLQESSPVETEYTCNNDIIISPPFKDCSDSSFTLTKTPVSDTVNFGDEISFTIEYSNDSGNTIEDMVITDPLPQNTDFVSCSGGGEFSDGAVPKVTWELGDIAPGASGSLTITISLNHTNAPVTVVENKAYAWPVTVGSNIAVVSVNAPEYGFAISPDSAGESIFKNFTNHFSFTVYNCGTTTDTFNINLAGADKFSYMIDTGMITAVKAAGKNDFITSTLGALLPFESRTFNIEVTQNKSYNPGISETVQVQVEPASNPQNSDAAAITTRVGKPGYAFGTFKQKIWLLDMLTLECSPDYYDFPESSDPGLYYGAIRPDGKQFLAGLSHDLSIAVIDPAENITTDYVSLPSSVNLIKYTKDGKYAVVTSNSNQIYLLNSQTFDITNIDVLYEQYYVDVSPSGEYLAYIGDDDDNLLRLDFSDINNPVVSTVAGFGNIKDIKFSNDGKFVFVTDTRKDTITIINAASGIIAGEIPATEFLTEMAVTPDGLYLYVINFRTETLLKINLKTNAVEKSIPVGENLEAVECSPDNNYVFVSRAFHEDIVVIQRSDDSIIKHIYVPDGVGEIILFRPSRSLNVISAHGSPDPDPGTYYYEQGTTVTLVNNSQIIPGSESGTRYICTGYTLETTTGIVSDTALEATIAMDDDTTFTWNWKKQNYLTIVSPYGSPVGEGWYDENASANWSVTSPVDIASGERVVTDPASGTLLIDQPTTITIPWTIQYYLTATSVPSEGGIITIPSDSSPAEGWYNQDSEVLVIVSPALGYFFTGWGGALSGDTVPQIIPIESPKNVIAYFEKYNKVITTFETPSEDGWTSGSLPQIFSEPGFGYSGGSLVIAPTASDNFGLWQSPVDAIPAVRSDCIYQVDAALQTSGINPCEVPAIRLRTNANNFTQANLLVINSLGDCSFSPEETEKVYSQYFQPQGLAVDQDFLIAVDMLNIDASDATSGEILINSATVTRYALNTLPGETDEHTYTFDESEEGWTAAATIPGHTTPINEYTGTALKMTAQNNTDTFGFWNNTPSDISIQANKIYKGTYNVTSTSDLTSGGPIMRARMYSEDNQAIMTYEVPMYQLPSAPDKAADVSAAYYIYFMPPQSLVGQEADGLGIAIDMLNINTESPAESFIQLDELNLKTYDLPQIEPIPVK